MRYVLAVHGGAGTILPGQQDEARYHAGLREALAAGEAVLRAGGSAVQAVVASVVALEDCPLFNAGHGAVLTSAGTHELDAGVMDGLGLCAGAVAGVRHVRNPVRAAHALLAEGRCVLLGAEAADRFAATMGLPTVPNHYFTTPHRLAQLRALQAAAPTATSLDHADDDERMRRAPLHAASDDSARFGTVGAVALDAHGNLAAATSTGGMSNKRPGRIGDTPLVGAGVYANNATCAVSATGTGEHFIRACVGHDIHARIAHGGASLASAAHAVVHQSLPALGGSGGVIALARDGSLAMPFNVRGMYHGWVRSGEPPGTAIFP